MAQVLQGISGVASFINASLALGQMKEEHEATLHKVLNHFHDYGLWL